MLLWPLGDQHTHEEPEAYATGCSWMPCCIQSCHQHAYVGFEVFSSADVVSGMRGVCLSKKWGWRRQGPPDEADVDAQAAVHASAGEADEDAVGHR